jgi:8-oxo-dGTP diphosphatase
MSQPDKATIYIAAALIVDRAGRVLLVRKRGTQAFMQAGGKIELHESPAEALMRELDEELGLRLAPQAPEYLGAFVAQAANEENCTVTAEVFYIWADIVVTPAREIEEIAWISPSDVRLPLAPLTRDHLLPIAREKIAAAGAPDRVRRGLD